MMRLFNLELNLIKRFICMVVFTVSSTVLAGGEYPPGISKIKDRGKLIVAQVDKQAPPFFWIENDSYRGLDVVIAKSIAESLGVDLEFNRSATTFDEAVDLVAQGKADIAVSKLSITLKRSQKVRFTVPYVVLKKSLLINRKMYKRVSPHNSDEDFLKNFRYSIGVIKGTSYSDEAEDLFPMATIKQYEYWSEIVEAISSEKIMAAYRDELEIKRLVRLSPSNIKKYHNIIFEDAKDKIAIAVSWQAPHLHYWLNQFIADKMIKEHAVKLLDIYPEIYNLTYDH